MVETRINGPSRPVDPIFRPALTHGKLNSSAYGYMVGLAL